MRYFLSHSWRIPRLVWLLMVFELPFTVANLALFGIASPDLYRTILWAEGGRRGFNSDPTTILYAFANYRPVSIPLIWSSYNTQYHLVIGVTCMFFYLVKSTLWVLHVFVPLLSLVLHLALATLWAYGIYIQTSPDTIDPARMNKGAPWYITKSCGIVQDKNVRSYCMQAKSAFAISVVMLSIYTLFVIISVFSLIPTPAQKSARASQVSEERIGTEKWTNSPVDNEMTADQQWQHMWELQQLPRTPRTPGSMAGMKSPMSPRARAFHDLDGAEFGQSSVGRAWQGKYGGHGGVDVKPELREDYDHDETRKSSAGKSSTGLAY